MKSPLIVRRVEGHSMWPTLMPDDVVLASSLFKIRPGAVVIADVDGRQCIKRVESIDTEGIHLLGDNYYHSRDSRQFGAVNRRQILGTVMGYPRTFNASQRAMKA